MLVKLLIIAAIVGGGIVLLSDVHGLFPDSANSTIDSLKSDIGTLGDKTKDSVGETLDHSVTTVQGTMVEVKDKSENIKDDLNKQVNEFTLDDVFGIFSP